MALWTFALVRQTPATAEELKAGIAAAREAMAILADLAVALPEVFTPRLAPSGTCWAA